MQAPSRIRRELFSAGDTEIAEKQQKILTTEDTEVTEVTPKAFDRKGRKGIRKVREGRLAGRVRSSGLFIIAVLIIRKKKAIGTRRENLRTAAREAETD